MQSDCTPSYIYIILYIYFFLMRYGYNIVYDKYLLETIRCRSEWTYMGDWMGGGGSRIRYSIQNIVLIRDSIIEISH